MSVGKKEIDNVKKHIENAKRLAKIYSVVDVISSNSNDNKKIFS